MSRRAPLALITALALWASPAAAYVATNGLVVRPQGDTEFFVPFGGLAGDTDFFCAASDYVIFRLNLPWRTRIYRLSEPPRRSGEGIGFSLLPEGAASKSGLLIYGGKDVGVSASLANTFCPMSRRFFFFGLF